MSIIEQIYQKKHQFICDNNRTPNRLLLGDQEHRALTEHMQQHVLVRDHKLIGHPDTFEAMVVLRILQNSWLEVAFV